MGTALATKRVLSSWNDGVWTLDGLIRTEGAASGILCCWRKEAAAALDWVREEEAQGGRFPVPLVAVEVERLRASHTKMGIPLNDTVVLWSLEMKSVELLCIILFVDRAS